MPKQSRRGELYFPSSKISSKIMNIGQLKLVISKMDDNTDIRIAIPKGKKRLLAIPEQVAADSVWGAIITLKDC